MVEERNASSVEIVLRLLVFASVPTALVIAGVVPLSSSTEFLFYPTLVLPPLAVAVLVGPFAWPGVRIGRILEAVLAAVFSLGATLFVAAFGFTAVDDVDLWILLFCAVPAFAVYVAGSLRLARRDLTELPLQWAKLSVSSIAVGVAVLAVALAVQV